MWSRLGFLQLCREVHSTFTSCKNFLMVSFYIQSLPVCAASGEALFDLISGKVL